MAARAPDRRGPRPLWAQVQDDLVRRVRTGEFDDAFPGELALVEAYGVSRHTVRQALSHLRADGVVVAERGRVPRLAAGAARARVDQPLGSAYSLFASVEDAGLTQTSRVRRLTRVADGVVAARLGLEESTPLLHLERVRLADDRPLAWDRVWLPDARAAALRGVDFTRTALYDELSRRAGVVVDGGHERIGATVATPPQAALLEVPVAAALLHLDRLGTSGGEPVEWRCTLVRADRFALSAEFGPGADARFTAAPSPAPGHPAPSPP